MRSIKYILVHETGSKNADCDVTYRALPHIGHCIVCDASSKWQVPGSKSRAALIDRLVRLRRHYPETPILGWSELDTSYRSAPVRVNPDMNVLRREMSDLP